MLKFIPPYAKRILDLGCGTGRLGAALKARQECEVVGVDTDEIALEQARKRIDQTFCNDLDSPPDLSELTIRPEIIKQFDCVVAADILEHLREPARCLDFAKSVLLDAGTLVLSIPNTRNWQVIAALAEGIWQYEPAGLLDATHVRCFTRRMMEQLLDAGGFVWTREIAIAGPGFQEWVDGGKQGKVEVGRMAIRDLSEMDAQELYVYQWQFVCQKAGPIDYGLTSIIIPVWNGLQDTQTCLNSIRTHTPEHMEIIVVDNGSTDGTGEWLAAQTDAKVFINELNRGFPAAVNQGLVAATGDQLLVLNNDTLVTAGWLRRMIECLRSEPGIGIVGPRSNNVSGNQQLAVGYRSTIELYPWAWDWSMRRRGEYLPTNRLVGFCLLIDRACYESIGGLDEEFGIGMYDDDDYCKRAEAAGFSLRVSNAAFVHHAGSATFRREGIDFNALLAVNRAKFAAKWQA